MKKTVVFTALFFVFSYTTNADDLANILQDLAVQTACLGMYSSAQAGTLVTSRYTDPPDWYTPPMLAGRFAAMSGNMTRTITFYGVCFDYAQFAWDDIKKYQKQYNAAGMKGTEWYIAMTKIGDPNTIILYDPVSKEKATIISNGVYLKEKARHRVSAHDGATGHAWLWVQHNNGTWYWIDPTWTDNTGYPWWGIVSNGMEVQYYPNPDYSVASNYPRPQQPQQTRTERKPRGPNPTYNTGRYDPSQSGYLLVGYNFISGMPLGLTIADSMFLDKSLIYISANLGVSDNPGRFEFEWTYGVAVSITDWLRIPIGIGGNHLAKDDLIFDDYGNSYYSANGDLKHTFVIEAGIQPVIMERFYFSATYRLSGFKKSSFTLGAGMIF